MGKAGRRGKLLILFARQRQNNRVERHRGGGGVCGRNQRRLGNATGGRKFPRASSSSSTVFSQSLSASPRLSRPDLSHVAYTCARAPPPRPQYLRRCHEHNIIILLSRPRKDGGSAPTYRAHRVYYRNVSYLTSWSRAPMRTAQSFPLSLSEEYSPPPPIPVA